MSAAVPLLLQCPPAPTSPSPLHRNPLARSADRALSNFSNRNSFPPDQRQESHWASLLARATPARPYGACSPAPTHRLLPVPGSPSPCCSYPVPAAPRVVPSASTRPRTLTSRVEPVSVRIESTYTTTAPRIRFEPGTADPAPSRTSAAVPRQPAADIQQHNTVRGAVQADRSAESGRPILPTSVSFTRALTSPTAIKFFTPSRRLNKSQSQLIMPRMKSLFRGGQASRPMPREASLKNLSNYQEGTSPEPLIRKCHTVLALSTSGGGAHTRLVKEKRASKLDFLRRMSPSKSVVFSPNKLTLTRSPSALSELRRFRREPSVALSPESETAGVCSRCTSAASIASRGAILGQDSVFCKLCLTDVSIREMYQLQQCLCRFCKYCMAVYVALKIREGDYVIECPDANCDCSGELTLEEMESLVGSELFQLHLKFRKNTEVDMDPLRVWCPTASCETVVGLTMSKLEGPQCATCPTCTTVFCAACSEPWHPSLPCHADTPGHPTAVPNDERIKRCPSCKVPIERDAGCAQMLCKKCKHVFCWYCLTSLDDDFLLRHYDKGPCKNKLGHSRASVLWHRAQVIGIFAGFGLLLVAASPLLLFVGPCLLCCKCKPCSKHDGVEEDSLYGI